MNVQIDTRHVVSLASVLGRKLRRARVVIYLKIATLLVRRWPSPLLPRTGAGVRANYLRIIIASGEMGDVG
jgi:hypothetical protein